MVPLFPLVLFDFNALAQGTGHLVVDQDAVVIRDNGPPALTDGQRGRADSLGEGNLVGHGWAGFSEADDNQGDNH